MNDKPDNTETQRTEELKGTCPFCLCTIDVYLDIKARPYWRCWRCEVRLFGTKTAMKMLKADGWIWTDERPLEELQAWLRRIAKSVGLGRKRKK